MLVIKLQLASIILCIQYLPLLRDLLVCSLIQYTIYILKMEQR
nr:MAG TPA: hypothetical protein [Caudoviricetes sp.]